MSRIARVIYTAKSATTGGRENDRGIPGWATSPAAKADAAKQGLGRDIRFFGGCPNSAGLFVFSGKWAAAAPRGSLTTSAMFRIWYGLIPCPALDKLLHPTERATPHGYRYS